MESTAGFEPDVGRFYELAATWHEDVTLAGADTILAQEPSLADAELPGPAPAGPILVIVDGRGRVSAVAVAARRGLLVERGRGSYRKHAST